MEKLEDATRLEQTIDRVAAASQRDITPSPCGVTLPSRLTLPEDRSGCTRPHGHVGPHLFTGISGQHYEWMLDENCHCLHCQSEDADSHCLFISEPNKPLKLPLPCAKPTEPPAKTPSANDMQVAGNHYANKAIQPWDYIASNNLCFFAGNVVKYVTRFREKNGIADLQKARHYINKLIELETAKNA